MSGGLIGIFGLGSPASEPTPIQGGFLDPFFFVALVSTQIGVTSTREDRTDNRIYLRNERLAQTTARPGDIVWSKAGVKEGWILCDGAATIGQTGASYSGDTYRALFDAIKTTQVWGVDLITVPSSSIVGLTQWIKI